jgi:DNA-directed RNA polymerase alpha subunit
VKRVGPLHHRHRKPENPQWAEFFSEEEQEEAHRQDLLDTSLADTSLPTRVINTLESHGIEHVRDLIKLDRKQLLTYENFGDKTLDDCRAAMEQLGIAHPDWSPTPKGKSPRKGKTRH